MGTGGGGGTLQVIPCTLCATRRGISISVVSWTLNGAAGRGGTRRGVAGRGGTPTSICEWEDKGYEMVGFTVVFSLFVQLASGEAAPIKRYSVPRPAALRVAARPLPCRPRFSARLLAPIYGDCDEITSLFYRRATIYFLTIK